MSSSPPRVSMIMPVYNGLPHVRQAVSSVLTQDEADWELIIVNDGSTDGTGDYLDALADPRIRVHHQVNLGVSVARNVGLEQARGEFVTLLDADDALPPGSLRVRADYLSSHPDIDVVDGVMTHFDAAMVQPLSHHVPHYQGDFLPPLLRLDATVFRLPFYMLRRQAVGATRFKPGMSHCEDLLFLIHMAASRPVTYGHVLSPVYHYRTGHGSAMSNIAGLEAGYFDLLSEVARLPSVHLRDRWRLRLRVARILLLCWGRSGHWGRGCRCLLTVLLGHWRTFG